MKLTIGTGPGARPLLPEITKKSRSYTFSHPDGLLHATQFTQPALVLVEKAAFEELHHNGYVGEDIVFAGHSLGEYAALTSVAKVLSIEQLVEVVFLRGMVMQNSVPRDAAGRSEFGMMVASPNRVAPGFTYEKLESIVEAINEKTGRLLQIVNLNLRNRQYAVAGETRNLYALGEVCTVLNIQATKREEVDIDNLVAESIAHADEAKKSLGPNGHIELRRGMATIPLVGTYCPARVLDARAGDGVGG